MEFIEAPAFTRHVSDYLDDDDYGALQNLLTENPEAGDVMPGTGGFRKLRWADPRRGKGRRGGLRVIYYYFLSDSQILLVTIYDKDKAADLTPAEKKALKTAIAAELDARAARKLARDSGTRRRRR
jgi:mRNA-degrading endonuclease RelE of RelBE toxin-antitoxin system